MTMLNFPFTAIVGQDALKLALQLCAIDPGIGGILITGPRGTAKSTVARGLADLIQSAPFVNLPLGATEEQVIGSLDLEKVLADGSVSFQPGLLSKAHGGVLYVDEVNLLPDYLVDILLDVCATGVNFVERDGVSYHHAARFILVGTMNPDEGELRPQLLDRFGLSVCVNNNIDTDGRAEILQRRLAFDRDRETFVAHYKTAQSVLIDQIQSAKENVQLINLPKAARTEIGNQCVHAQVDGLRADIVMAKAATAHAAWRGAKEVAVDDVELIADFVLHHRRQNTSSSASSEMPPSTQPNNKSTNDVYQREGQWGAMSPTPVDIGDRRSVGELRAKKR